MKWWLIALLCIVVLGLVWYIWTYRYTTPKVEGFQTRGTQIISESLVYPSTGNLASTDNSYVIYDPTAAYLQANIYAIEYALPLIQIYLEDKNFTDNILPKFLIELKEPTSFVNNLNAQDTPPYLLKSDKITKDTTIITQDVLRNLANFNVARGVNEINTEDPPRRSTPLIKSPPTAFYKARDLSFMTDYNLSSGFINNPIGFMLSGVKPLTTNIHCGWRTLDINKITTRMMYNNYNIYTLNGNPAIIGDDTETSNPTTNNLGLTPFDMFDSARYIYPESTIQNTGQPTEINPSTCNPYLPAPWILTGNNYKIHPCNFLEGVYGWRWSRDDNNSCWEDACNPNRIGQCGGCGCVKAGIVDFPGQVNRRWRPSHTTPCNVSKYKNLFCAKIPGEARTTPLNAITRTNIFTTTTIQPTSYMSTPSNTVATIISNFNEEKGTGSKIHKTVKVVGTINPTSTAEAQKSAYYAMYFNFTDPSTTNKQILVSSTSPCKLYMSPTSSAENEFYSPKSSPGVMDISGTAVAHNKIHCDQEITSDILRLLPFQTRDFIRRWAIGRRTRIQTWYQQKCLTFAPSINTGEAATVIAAALAEPGVTFLDNTRAPPTPEPNTKMLPAQLQLATRGNSFVDNQYKAYLYNISTLNSYCYANSSTESTASRNNPTNFSINNPYTVVFATTQNKSNVPCSTQDTVCTKDFLSGIQTSCETSTACYTPAKSTNSEKNQTVYTSSGSTKITIPYPPAPINSRTYQEPYTSPYAVAPKFDMQSNPNVSPSVFVTQTTNTFTPSFTIHQEGTPLVNQPGKYTINLTVPTTPVGIDSFLKTGISVTVESALTPTSFFSGRVLTYSAGALKLYVVTHNVYINYVKQGTDTQVTNPWNPALPNDKYIISFTDPQSIQNIGSISNGVVTLFPIKINPNKVSKIVFNIPQSQIFSNLPPTPPSPPPTPPPPPPTPLNVIVSKFSEPTKYFNGTAIAYDPTNTTAKLTVNITAQAVEYDNTGDHYSTASNYLISLADTTTSEIRTYLFREEKQQIMNMIAQKYYDLSGGAVVIKNILDVYQVGDTLFDVRFSDSERDPIITAQIQTQIAKVRSEYERTRTLNLKDDEFLSLESNYTDQMITLNAALNSAVRGAPDQICGVNARFVVIKRTDGTAAAPVRIELSQIVVIDSTGNNVAYNAQIKQSKADVYAYENPDAYAYIFPDGSTLTAATGIVKNSSNTIINDPRATTISATMNNFPISNLSTITNGNVVVLKQTSVTTREPANIQLIKMNRSLTLVDGNLKPRVKPYYYYGISSGNELDNTIIIDLGSSYDITNVRLIFPLAYAETPLYQIGFLNSVRSPIVLRIPESTSSITYVPETEPIFIQQTKSSLETSMDFRITPESRIDCPVELLNPYKVARFYANIDSTFSVTASPQTNIRALSFTGYSLGQSAALTFNPMYNAGFTLNVGAGGGNMNYNPNIVYKSNSVTPGIGSATLTTAPTNNSPFTINASGSITSIVSSKLINSSVTLTLSTGIFFKGTITAADPPVTTSTTSVIPTRSITIDIQSITGTLPASGTYKITLNSGEFYAGTSTNLCTNEASLKNILKDYMAYIGTTDFKTRADIEPLLAAGDYDVSEYRFYPQEIIGYVSNNDGTCGIKWTEKKIDPITNQNMTLIGSSISSVLLSPTAGGSQTMTLETSIPSSINISLNETYVTVRDTNNSSNAFNGKITAYTAAGSITIGSITNIKGDYKVSSTYEIYGGTYTRWGKFAYVVNKETWAAIDSYCDIAKSVIYTTQANYTSDTTNSAIPTTPSIPLTQLLPIEAQSLQTIADCGAAKCSDIPVIHSLVEQYNSMPVNSGAAILRVTKAVTVSPNACEFTAYTQGNSSPAYITMNVSPNSWNSTETCPQQTYSIIDTSSSSVQGTFIQTNTPIITAAYNYAEEIMKPYRDMLTNATSGVVPKLSTLIQRSSASSTLTTYRSDTYGAYGQIKDLSGCAPNAKNASCASEAVIREFVKTYNSRYPAGKIMTEVTHAGTATAAGEKTCDFIGTIRNIISAPNGIPEYNNPETVGIRATMVNGINTCYFTVDTAKPFVNFTSLITGASFQNLQTINSLPGISAQVAGNPIFLGSIAPRTIGVISSQIILPVNDGTLKVTVGLPTGEPSNIMSLLLKKANLPITIINDAAETIQFTGLIDSYDETKNTENLVIKNISGIYPPKNLRNTGAYNAAYNRAATYTINTVYYIGGLQPTNLPDLPNGYTIIVPREVGRNYVRGTFPIPGTVSLPVTTGNYSVDTVVTITDIITPSNVLTGKINSITGTNPKILTISITSKKGSFIGAYNSYIIHAYALEGVPGALNKDGWTTPTSLGLPSEPTNISGVSTLFVTFIVDKNSSSYRLNTKVIVRDINNSSNFFKGKITAYIPSSGELTIGDITDHGERYENTTQFLVSALPPELSITTPLPIDTVDFVDCNSLTAFHEMGIPGGDLINIDSRTCKSEINNKIYKFSQVEPGASLIVTEGKETDPYVFPLLENPLPITVEDAHTLYPYIDVDTPPKRVHYHTWDFRITKEDNFPFGETYKRIRFYIDTRSGTPINRIRYVSAARIGISEFSFLKSATPESDRESWANAARTAWNKKYANVQPERETETETIPMVPKIIIGTITGYYENMNTDTVTYRATASDFGPYGPTDIRNYGIRYFQFTFRYKYTSPNTVIIYDMIEIPTSTATTYAFTAFSNSMNNDGSDCSATDDRDTRIQTQEIYRSTTPLTTSGASIRENTNTYRYCSSATVPKLQTLSDSVNSNLRFNYLRFKVDKTPVSSTQSLFPAEISEINFYVRKTLEGALTERGQNSSSTITPIRFSTINQANAKTHLVPVLFSKANYRVQDISGQGYYIYKLNKNDVAVCNNGYTGPTSDPTNLSYGICTLDPSLLSAGRQLLNSYTMKTTTATYEGKGTYTLDCAIGYSKNNTTCAATGMFGRANIKNAIFNPSMPRLKLNTGQYYYIDLNDSVQIEAFNFVTGAADNRPLRWTLEGSVSGTLPGVVPGSPADLVQWVTLHSQTTDYPYTEHTVKGTISIYSFLETNYFIFTQALEFQKNIFGQEETTRVIANPNTVGTAYQKYAYHFTYDPSTASSTNNYASMFEGFKGANILEQPDRPLPKARRNESRLDPIYTLPLQQAAISTPVYKELSSNNQRRIQYLRFTVLETRGNTQTVSMSNLIFTTPLGALPYNHYKITNQMGIHPSSKNGPDALSIQGGCWISANLQPLLIRFYTLPAALVEGFQFSIPNGRNPSNTPSRWRLEASYDGRIWETYAEQLTNGVFNGETSPVYKFRKQI